MTRFAIPATTLNNVLGNDLASSTRRASARRSSDRASFEIIAEGARRAGGPAAAAGAYCGENGKAVWSAISPIWPGYTAPPPVVLNWRALQATRSAMDRAGVQLLATIVSAARAESILEGTAYGFGDLHGACAKPRGPDPTIDPDTAAPISHDPTERAGAASRNEIVNQPALDAIETTKHLAYDLASRCGKPSTRHLDAVMPPRTPGVIVVDTPCGIICRRRAVGR